MHISASSLFVKVLMWMRIFAKCEDNKGGYYMKKLIFIMVFAMTITSNVALASDNKPQTCCESMEIPRSREKNVTTGNSAVFRRVIE